MTTTCGNPPRQALTLPMHMLGLLSGCLMLLGLASVPRVAAATCWYTSGAATTVAFNAGTVTLTPGTTIGQVLWTSSVATPANPPVMQCDGTTNSGIANTIAGPPTGSNNTLFPTGIPGISYRLLHPDAGTLLASYPNYPVNSGTFSVTTNLQLVFTGPYLPPNNSTLIGPLAQWNVDTCSNPQFSWWGGYNGCKVTVTPQPVEYFNISATILVQVPTCTLAGPANFTVTLPDATLPQFTGTGSTANKQPFSLNLTSCPNGQKVFITLDTSNPQTGTTGVIAPSGAGYATNIGVQLLQANGTTPVTFGTAINTGTATASNFTINLFAQYYQTAPIVSAGPVRAVATYTLNYQ